MMTLADLRPGDIGFGPISGAAGALVSIGQLALGEGFHVGPLDIRHVFIVTEVNGARADVVEAMPSGARSRTIGSVANPVIDVDARWDNRFAYVRLPEDYPGQAEDAAAIARAMIGTPYSFASYAALAAWRMGWKTPRLERWINRRRPDAPVPGLTGNRPMTSEYRSLPCEAICSVLVDQAWSLAGKKVMEGVAHQCVTPGALAARLLSMPGTRWIWPGVS